MCEASQLLNLASGDYLQHSLMMYDYLKGRKGQYEACKNCARAAGSATDMYCSNASDGELCKIPLNSRMVGKSEEYIILECLHAR